MSSLFEAAAKKLLKADAPLADRMRPTRLSDFVGQEEVVGAATPLKRAIEADELTSMILWGPPGSGKTTLARIIAELTKSHFVAFSAVVSGVREAREVIERARDRRLIEKRRTILFVDEIHRFNKAQQDAFLPAVEDGTIILIGATTENPSFEINAALLSRCRVFVLKPLSEEALGNICRRALADRDAGLGKENIDADEDALDLLARSAGGDARVALSNLEWVAACLEKCEGESRARLTADHVRTALPHKVLLYDKKGEEHFNLISALQKSVRGSDPQGSLYWLARMLVSGEDPMYIARRLVRIAVEDIGLADPQALSVALSAKDAYHLLGTPEGELALAQAAIYLATAPKSNSAYLALSAAMECAKDRGPLPVPMHLRNPVTGLMKAMGYGEGYKYAHDFEDAYAPQVHLPDEIKEREFYQPGSFGYEREIHKRIQWWRKLSGGTKE